MSIIVNGTTIPDNDDYIKVGSTLVDKVDVVKDGVRTTVWEKIVFDSKEFSYIGSIEEFVVPITGLYKLEAWGGEGGTAISHSYQGIQVKGGLGGYAVSYVELVKDTILYVCVGSRGPNATATRISYAHFTVTNSSGTRYNGGGASISEAHQDGVSYQEHYFIIANGGSCTHIATKSGLLSSLESYKSDVLVVAGGAGAGGYNHEPKENGGNDVFVQAIGGNGGTGGDGGGFGTNVVTSWFFGYGSGWSSGRYYHNGSNFYTTGGTNRALGLTYKGTTYNAISKSGINSGNGKAKITFVTA